MNKLVSSKLPETKFLSNNICVRIGQTKNEQTKNLINYLNSKNVSTLSSMPSKCETN